MREKALDKLLIIGFGNVLMGDDGAGIHLLRRLEQQNLPAGVELLDGGVSSFAALTALQQASSAILVDSMAGGGRPGEVYRLTGGDLEEPAVAVPLSAHDFSLLDSLRLARRTMELPPLVLYGIEPASLELSMELSPQVSEALDKVTTHILNDLRPMMQGR